MAALNAEIPSELKKALDHACLDRDMTLKAAVAEALRNWVEFKAPASKRASESPGLFDGLNEDQIWRLRILADLLRADPQTPAFRILRFALDQAVKEHVAESGGDVPGKHRKRA
jgi:hypothetical protein